MTPVSKRRMPNMNLYEPFSNGSVGSRLQDFQLALKQAFESFLNKDTRTAQYLSLYVDDQFRKGLKGLSSDAEVDQALEQAQWPTV